MYSRRTITLCMLAALGFGGAVIGVGCSGGDEAASGATQSGGNSNGTSQGGAGPGSGSGSNVGGSGGSGGDITFFDAGPDDGGLDPDSACATQSSEAELVKKPVDVIFVIDNSGSMGEEIIGVQNNINSNFAKIIEESGLDYRVIIVAKHGPAKSAQSICVEAPLSGIKEGGCASPPKQPVNNPPRFYHYSVEVASHDSWCKALSTFNVKDEFSLAPKGWSEWLRPEAFKTFIELSDDGVNCSYGGVTYNDGNKIANGEAAAVKFDEALLKLSPEQFGTKAERNYSFYSIVAMGYNDPPTKPYVPKDPILTSKCPTAADPGTGHQALSVLTGALRFPLCDTTSYDAVFKAIAEGVISGAKASCNFDVPEPPKGTTIDLDSVVVEYTPSQGGAVQFKQVADKAACEGNAFYIEEAKKKISLCPDTCAVVQKDEAAKVNVLFACDEGGAN